MSFSGFSTKRSNGWRIAGSGDISFIQEFLTQREAWACTCSDRIRHSSLSFSNPRLAPNSIVILPQLASPGIEALVFFSKNGLVFPVFGNDNPDLAFAYAELPKLKELKNKGFQAIPFSCIGRKNDVSFLESCFCWEPVISIDYFAMTQAEGLVPTPMDLSEITFRPAIKSDLKALLPLACAYDREEVLTSLHQFNPGVSKAAQIHSLTHFTVCVAEYKGRLVGRAQTNAIGYKKQQIGGVYVVPELRGRGIGTALMQFLLGRLNSKGWLSSLFVKQGNISALKMYNRLGYQRSVEYRIDYFG